MSQKCGTKSCRVFLAFACDKHARECKHDWQHRLYSSVSKWRHLCGSSQQVAREPPCNVVFVNALRDEIVQATHNHLQYRHSDMLFYDVTTGGYCKCVCKSVCVYVEDFLGALLYDSRECRHESVLDEFFLSTESSESRHTLRSNTVQCVVLNQTQHSKRTADVRTGSKHQWNRTLMSSCWLTYRGWGRRSLRVLQSPNTTLVRSDWKKSRGVTMLWHTCVVERGGSIELQWGRCESKPRSNNQRSAASWQWLTRFERSPSNSDVSIIFDQQTTIKYKLKCKQRLPWFSWRHWGRFRVRTGWGWEWCVCDLLGSNTCLASLVALLRRCSANTQSGDAAPSGSEALGTS